MGICGIEKAKEAYKGLKKNAFIVESIDTDFFFDFAETVLNEVDKDSNIISDLQNEVTLKQCELDKKDKIINEMANNIADSSNMYENLVNTEFQHTAEEVIDYFTKKAEDK